MRLFFLLLISFFALSACDSYVINEEGLVYLDTDKEYPELKLCLSDIADIYYIKLRGEEQRLIINEVSSDICFDKNRGQIILGKRKKPYFIAVFDNNGQFLRQISHEGQGPGEFFDGVRLVYYEKDDIISIFEYSDKVIQYHSSGEFIRERQFDFLSPFTRLFQLDDKLVMINVFSQYVTDMSSDEPGFKPIVDDKWTLRALDINTLEDLPIKDHHFTEIMDNKLDALSSPDEGYCLTDDGILFVSARSDTTYLIDHNLVTRPFMVDIRHKREQGFLLVPTFETKDYLFLHLIPPGKKGFQTAHRYFAIRRSDKAIFSCGSNRAFSIYNNSNSLSLSQDIQSATPGFGQKKIFKDIIPNPPDPDFPIPPEVEVMAKEMNYENNPILMIIKFK